MQISVASSSLISIPIIEAIKESTHNLASLITLPDRKVGRGQGVVENDLAQWAKERSIPVAKPADISQINQHLLEVQPQLVVTASYGKLIPPELLHGPRFGWLNLHFSLLPRWRGAAPVQWSILEGDSKTGITIFKLDKGMDTGPIYLQEEVDLSDSDTTEMLLDHIAALGGSKILGVIDQIARAEKPKPQSQSGVTLAPKISKEMGHLDWSETGLRISRISRALGVRPGIYSFMGESKVSIHGVDVFDHLRVNRRPGEFWLEGDKALVCAGDCTMSIAQVTPSGKKRMKATDFLRGVRLNPGEGFEPRG